MTDDAGDHEAEAAREIGASAENESELDAAKALPHRPAGRIAGKHRGDVGTLPRQQLVHLRYARSHEGGAGRLRRDQDDAAVRATKGRHRPAQQQDVAEGPRPDDERGQGTSMRAVEALPSRSVPRTTRTWGPGEPRFPTGIS